ncbi:MAG: tetratricopeptide repeat protein [Oligoflexia bacterium]|nr:tetratricopeptide repeat protein [Oligoflexia bacterium]
MVAQVKKWIVRSSDGHIYGPFEAHKVGELLGKGVFSGEEQVAIYPAGDWIPMSSETELYNLVLQALSGSSPKAPQSQNPPTQQNPKDPITQTGTQTGTGSVSTRRLKNTQRTKTVKIADEDVSRIDVPPFKKPQVPTGQNNQQHKNQQVNHQPIELSDKKKIKRKQVTLVPLIFLALAGVLFYFAFNYPKLNSKRSAISLLRPQISKNNDPAKSKELVNKGWGYFYKDTYTNYVRAAESFVLAIEASPANAEAILMLLMADLELWPFAKQDSGDQSTVQGLLQLIAKADPYGTQRSIAAAIVDIILSRDAEAGAKIDASLQTQPGEGRLYALKGHLFFNSGEYQQSIAYYQKTASLLTSWVKSNYMTGVNHSKAGLAGPAQQFLIQALKMNPSHAAARLELGIVEAKYFNHDEKAREYLTVALDSNEKILPANEARGRIYLAMLLAKSGDKTRSKKEAEKALALSPSDPEIKDLVSRFAGGGVSPVSSGDDRQHMNIGDQYMRTNNYLAAQAQFKSAFSLNPKNARAAVRAAEALWGLHQSAGAIEYLQKAIAADPKFITSYTLLSDYKAQRFDFDGATRALEMALRVNQKSYEVYRGYAQLFLRRADYSSAEVYANRSLQLYETDVKTNEMMGRIQLAKKDVVKALQYSKRAIDLDPSNAEAQVEYARAKATYEGVKGASNYLNQLIEKYPMQLTYRVGLAEILLTDEQYAPARQILEQVVAADNMHKEAYLLLGDALFLSNELEAALSNYLSSARVDPSDPAGLFRAGELYLKAKRPADAEKQFKLVIQINPLFPRAYFNMARAHYDMGTGDLALKDLEQEKKMNPKLADPYEFSGDILLASRKYQLATKDYQKAAEIRPLGAAIYVKLAKAYRGQGSLDAALAMLRLASAKESGVAEIYKEQGAIFETKGMASEAVSSYKRYLQLDPSPPDKEAVLSKIRELE